MARPTILRDEALYEGIILNLARGVPQVLIAKSLGVPETTISGWKRRPDFSRDLALKIIELAAGPLDKMRVANPVAFLERHPEFRDHFKPPDNTLKIEFTGWDGNKTPA